MQSYQTIKEMKLRDNWLKAHGYNPGDFFSPDIAVEYVRAKAANRMLLANYSHMLDDKQLRQCQRLNLKSTKKEVFQVLNLYKKIQRQAHRQSK